MPWGAQSWLKITPETTYGVRNGAGAATWCRLHADDAFTMRPAPLAQIIRSADGGNRRRQRVAARTAYAGQLTTLMYPTQAAVLLGAAFTLTSNDLGSYTLDFFDSVRVQGYLGAKVKSLKIVSQADQDYLIVQIGWVAQRLDASLTTLAQPLDNVFPSEVPYEHVETDGLVTVGGSAIGLYRGITVDVTNVLTGTWDEKRYITSCYYGGRDVDVQVDLQYVSTAFRAALEAQTALTVSLGWARTSPTKSVTLDLKTKDYVAVVADRIPLSGPAYQTVSIESFYDQGAGTDCALTVV